MATTKFIIQSCARQLKNVPKSCFIRTSGLSIGICPQALQGNPGLRRVGIRDCLGAQISSLRCYDERDVTLHYIMQLQWHYDLQCSKSVFALHQIFTSSREIIINFNHKYIKQSLKKGKRMDLLEERRFIPRRNATLGHDSLTIEPKIIP